MKPLTYLSLFILLSFGSYFEARSQSSQSSDDKYLLLTMPYNQRQLTLYKGQLQINTGYKFAVRTQAYNSTGDLINLKNNGTGSVYHYYFLDVRYGLTSFIELGAETDFLRRGVRDTSVTIVSVTSNKTENVTVNKMTESKGMGDIFLFSSLRLPVEFQWFDFSLTGGVFFPSAKYKPQQPDGKTITTASTLTTNSYTINLHYNYKNGYGVPVYMIGAATKISYHKITAEAEFTMRTPAKEGTSIRWDETLADKVFSYSNSSYSYLLSNTYTLDFSMHYQATGWFNLDLNGSYLKTKGGWTEYWGNKYRNPETSLFNLEPGVELQISPHIIVYQVAGFPLRGKNNDAPFYLFTTFSFNMFPFHR